MTKIMFPGSYYIINTPDCTLNYAPWRLIMNNPILMLFFVQTRFFELEYYF